MKKLCFIGFGEVGQTLCADFDRTASDFTIAAWDVQFPDPDSIPSKGAASASAAKAVNTDAAVADADLVISAVTAAQTLDAAQSAAPAMKPGAWYFDLNSASPGVKARSAAIINDGGGRYIEGAVMSPIGPKRIATSILLGGPDAEAFAAIAQGVGFSGASVFSDAYGKASAAKMCRSVMVKGIESLLTESLLCARHYGVEETVIASLDDLFPGLQWEDLAHYMISRSIAHGERRAEEMREVARTVSEAGFEPLMSAACAARQDWAAARGGGLAHADLRAMLDAMAKRHAAAP